jgi:hypothetical protein
MKRIRILGMIAVVAAGLAGCGKDRSDPEAQWFMSPDKVVQGLMHAYQTRNDTLFAAFLADDFHYYFEPEDADSLDVLGWGKEEEVVGTVSLFRTPDVVSLDYRLDYGPARSVIGAGKEGWMLVPVAGGRMTISVKDKDPVKVELNRQEILMRPESTDRWRIVEWHDYPAPEGDVGGE